MIPLLFLPTCLLAQQPAVILFPTRELAWTALKSGYRTISGWTIHKGDTIQIGNGTMPDKKFAFIYQCPKGFSTLTNDLGRTSRLLSYFAYRKLVVKKLQVWGDRVMGFSVMAMLRLGPMGNYSIEIDNAINSGELIVPPAYHVLVENKQTVDPPDELMKWEKLLNADAINQHEYDSVKSRLLHE